MIDAARVRAFPWGSLDSTTHAEALALRDARRWAAGKVDVARLPSVLGQLLGVEVEVLVRGARPVTAPQGLEGGAGVLVAPAESAAVARSIVVEAEGALVAAVLRRVTGRLSTFAFDPPGPLPAGAAGAFAAVLVAALRRAHDGAAFRVLAAGPAAHLEADVARAGGPLVAVSATVLVAHDAFAARVVLPQGALRASPSPAWSPATLASLGGVPLGVPVVACAFRVAAAELARLARGDVLVPASWPLARGASGLVGPVLLSAGDSAVGLTAQLGEDGRLVLRGELQPLEAAEATMGDGVERGEWVDAIGDVPVVVRVEIGEARMAARDWATIGRGDVVALGRRIGEPVVLRVGGVRVARGELVEIDGEVGVRVVERFADEAGAVR